MKSRNIILYTLIAFLFILTVELFNEIQSLENEIDEIIQPDLYVLMNQMQKKVHKLNYIIDHQNEKLVDFYNHELEEYIETITVANVEYHEQPVGQLTQNTLVSAVEFLEDALDVRDWMQVREKLGFWFNRITTVTFQPVSLAFLFWKKLSSTHIIRHFQKNDVIN